MNIEIGEKTCIRLGAFAHECELSLAAAIDRLLDNWQKSGRGRVTLVERQEQYEQFVRRRMQKGSTNPPRYVKAINRFCQDHNINVWDMTNAEEVRRIYRGLRKGAFDHPGNHTLVSPAVKKFVAFLESENSG